jgi:hypothetical protein
MIGSNIYSLLQVRDINIAASHVELNCFSFIDKDKFHVLSLQSYY